MSLNGLSPDELIGHELAGYRLTRILGTGGTGVVLLGEQATERVAIKLCMPPRHLTREERAVFLARFRREAATLQQIHQIHLVPVLATGEEDGETFMILRYMEGGTLADRIARHPQVFFATISRIVNEIAQALDAIHAAGIIHRDVKPTNILFDGQENAYLSDFSIARVADLALTTLTMTGQVLGTPEYMAPEQAQGEAVTPATDTYSLAVVVYAMLTGRVPFTAATPVQVLLQVVRDMPPSLRQFRPDLPEPAEAVLMRALAKDPTMRYAATTEFASALTAGLQGQWSSREEPVALPQASDNSISPPLTTTGANAVTAPFAAVPTTNSPHASRRSLFIILICLGLVFVLVPTIIGLGQHTTRSTPTAVSAHASATTAPNKQPTAPGPTPTEHILYSFENGTTEGWTGSGTPITLVNNSMDHAFLGTHSLEVRFNTLTPTSAPTVAVTVQQAVTTNAALILYVYASPGSAISARLFVQDNGAVSTSASYQSLTPGTWNRLELPLATQLNGTTVTQFGVQFYASSGTQSGSLWIDSVRWSATA